jgi:starch phosphorylase
MTQLLEVTSAIPAALARLPELASNLFFSWDRPTRALFEDLDPELWEQVNGNPRLLLRCVDQQHLERAAADREYLERYQRVIASYGEYMAAPAAGAEQPLIAYFCAEYGFHESFPIYSGGLGILAGDYCKAVSDEGLNFVAVGLMYRQGYFTQSVDSDGAQHALYADTDPRVLPVEPARTAAGQWLQVSLRIGDHDVQARVWRAEVGRVTVYLLDTNCAENSTEDRDITHRLYGGDDYARIRQEMVLGIGGVRVLRALGLAPAVWHINEGHAAFLIVELLREGMESGLDFDAALEAAAAQCVFTTHTPVAAGHDVFSDDLFRACFSDYVRGFNVDPDRIALLGRSPGARHGFNMTRLALAGARRVNGVSRIHGAVSAQLCADHWSDVPPRENPVGYVTNGVHVPTFLAQTWCWFFDSHIGADWRERLSDGHYWQALESVPDEVYWDVAQDTKSRMLHGVSERLRREYARKGLSAAQLRQITRFLDPGNPNVLTLGFARRFATYKRASLMLRDHERLKRLIRDSDRPVVFLFAGKAHPADQPGQQVLREIKQMMLMPEFAGHVLFLEDYDMQLARWLVSGVDVWLNNPIAPLEASGTSGIKASVNGRLNLSVLDGWWAEAWDGTNGWGLPGAQVQDPYRRDTLDAELMLDTLEHEVIPLYYDRRSGKHYSAQWVQYCKRAMMTVIPQFNMRRVVQDYVRNMYRPTAEAHQALAARGGQAASEFAHWKNRVRQAWGGTALRRLSHPPRELLRSASLRWRLAAALHGLDPRDVTVEFLGRRLVPRSDDEMPALASVPGAPPADLWRAVLEPSGEIDSDGSHVYVLEAAPPTAGQYDIEVRMVPSHSLLSHPLEMGLVRRLG